MGNSFTCFAPVNQKTSSSKSSPPIPQWILNRSSTKKVRSTTPASPKPDIMDDSYIKQQAILASKLYLQHMQNDNLAPQFDRSTSVQYTSSPLRKSTKKLRSRSVSHATAEQTLQFIKDQIANDQNSEKKHFVLVHGGGFGAWCWYKIIALLKESKCEVDAIDLNGSGANSCDINSIKTLAEYAKPLTDFLEELEDGKKIILVGHDLGGSCISYAMELYPAKVSKAIFVAATMLTSGQSALDVFSQEACLNELNLRARKFLYANGKNHAPTAIDFEKSVLDEFLFNRTTSKDVALASVSMRPFPFAPVTEKLMLSEANYGSVPRFYVQTEEDFALPVTLQEAMVKASPPKQVFQLKGSDHAPFFSRPQALLKQLMEISEIRV